MPLPSHPILVVSYTDETRTALATVLEGAGVVPAPCASFCEAESLALKGLYSGILVDLPSIVRSKGEEKIVACTLANFIPILRVRTIGGMLVPMSMPGSARQDSSLDDFLHKSCVAYTPKKLREFKRHPVCLSTLIDWCGSELRGFTLNISWGGMFVVDLQGEKFRTGDLITVNLPEFPCSIECEVRRTLSWGIQRIPPGIGLRFITLDEPVVAIISGITRTRKESDRDRLIS